MCVCVYVCVCTHAHALSHLSHVRLFATPWTMAHQAPLSMRFSRQEYWSGLSFPFPTKSLLAPYYQRCDMQEITIKRYCLSSPDSRITLNSYSSKSHEVH